VNRFPQFAGKLPGKKMGAGTNAQKYPLVKLNSKSTGVLTFENGLVGNLNPAFVEERRKALEMYLRYSSVRRPVVGLF
jgi:hypothetical protein